MTKLIADKLVESIEIHLRGLQFWDHTAQEQTEGIEYAIFMNYVGFFSNYKLTEARANAPYF